MNCRYESYSTVNDICEEAFFETEHAKKVEHPMKSQKQQKHVINLDYYTLPTVVPRRAKDPSSAYAIRRSTLANKYVDPAWRSPVAKKKKESALVRSIVIICSIIMLPLLIITPFIIAITLGRYLLI